MAPQVVRLTIPASGIGKERTIDNPDTVTLWRPTGQAELDLVAASGWRAWPPRLPDQPIFYPVLNRWYATKIAREWNVPAEGVGYVTRFDVQRTYLERLEVRQVGGRDVLEYWIPAEEVEDFNAHIVGAIVEEADYRGPVGDQEFTDAEEALGHTLPAAWRAYLRGGSWFRRGWMTNGTYVWLNTPREMIELQAEWGDPPPCSRVSRHRRYGTLEQRVLDLRRDAAPVMLVDVSSGGWDSAIRQADDVSEFIQRVEAGAFEFTFEE